jgi:sporulation protein YlmC with PRC-barrel domain
MNFEWPPYVGSVIGFLASVLAVVGTVAGGLLLARRLILAWRHWGHEPELGAFASRSDLLNEGLQLVGLKEGKPVGRVKDVILDLQTGCVAGFRVRAHWHTWLLPFAKVKNIGRDAVIVESAADLQRPAALPALATLAETKYRWESCEVVTDSGTRLGTTSWTRLWYNRTDGSVEVGIKSADESPISALLNWAIELASVSVLEPLSDWIECPAELSARVPLRTVRSANRKLVILNAEGEKQFKEVVQTLAQERRESIRSSFDKLKERMPWREKSNAKGGETAKGSLGN